MSVSHQLNNGLLGKATPSIIGMLPRFQEPCKGCYDPDTRNQAHGAIKGTDDPMRTTMQMMNGSVRGVMPCCGIQPTGVWGTRVLRREPPPSAGSMVVPQGAFKSEPVGLATLPTKPMNVRVQRPRDFCDPSRFSKILPPSFKLSA